MSRWAAQRPQDFCLDAHIAGAALRPIATQGRSYTKLCILQMEPIKKTGCKSRFSYAPKKLMHAFQKNVIRKNKQPIQ